MNKYGCKKSEDVCIEHDEPLVCKHGCSQQKIKCSCKITKDYYGEEIPRWGHKTADELFDKCFKPKPRRRT